MEIGVPDEDTLSAGPREHSQARDLSKAAPTPLSRNVPAIPGYRMEQRLGHGTFGEVWSAVQVRTGQRLAVKIYTHPQGLDWRYFRREVRRLSRVADHPYVVTLLDAELTYNPPFFTMPQLSGSLQEQVETERPRPEQALVWFEQMSRALDYAHSKGVFHCDLKPSNVLIDREGQARLADFGQALLPGEAGNALGTLWYMAPEQVVWEPGASLPEPDVRWDIYGLGATVYFALTGRPPRFSPGSQAELRAQGQSSPRLAAYRRILGLRALVPIRSLNPAVDADFAAIVESCLAIDPQDRTPTVERILTDLERRRRRLPLLCRAPWPLSYRVSRFVRRNLAAVVAVSLCTVVLLGAGIQVWRAQGTADVTMVEVSRLHSLLASRKGEEAASLAWLGRAAEQRPGNPDLYLCATRPVAVLTQVLQHRDRVNGLSFDRHGRRLLTVSDDDTAAVWRTGEPEPARILTHPAPVLAGRFLPGGRRVVTGCRDGRVRVWSLDTGKLALAPMQQGGAVYDVRCDASGKILLSSSSNRTARLWNAVAGTPLGGPLVHLGPMPALLSRDGTHVVTLSAPSTVTISSVSKKTSARSLGLPAPVTAMAIGGANRLAIGCRDGSVELAELGSATAPAVMFRRPGAIRALAFDASADRLAVGDDHGAIVLWDVRRGKPLEEFGSGAAVVGLSFSGRWLVSRSADGGVSCWTADGRRLAVQAGPGRIPAQLVGDRLALVSGRTVRVLRLVRPPEQRSSLGLSASLQAGALDGNRVAGVSSTGLAVVWAADTLARSAGPMRVGAPGPAAAELRDHQVLWLSGGRVRLGDEVFGHGVRAAALVRPGLVALARGHRVELWDAAGPRLVQAWDLAGHHASALACDGRLLVAGLEDGGLRAWDVTSGARRFALGVQSGPITCVAVCRNWVASGSGDATVAVLDRSGRLAYGLLRAGAPVTALAFDPGGERLAAGCADGAVKLWETASGFSLAHPWEHQAGVLALWFGSPDRLACLTSSGELSRWDLSVDADLPASVLLRLGQVWTGMAGHPGAAMRPMAARQWRQEREAALGALEAHRRSCAFPKACDRLLNLTGWHKAP